MARTIILDDYQEREVAATLADIGRAANLIADVIGLLYKNAKAGNEPFEDFSDPSKVAVLAVLDNAACRILNHETRAHELLGTSPDPDDVSGQPFDSPGLRDVASRANSRDGFPHAVRAPQFEGAEIG